MLKKRTITPVKIRPDGMGGYMFDGYGKLETALKMRRWNKQYNRRRRLRKHSSEKLRSWLKKNGYEILKDTGHEIAVQTEHVFAKLFVDPQDTGLIAKYEITDYYGLYDDVLTDNEAYLLD